MSKKIMVLEDDESHAELIEFYLKEEGYLTKVSPCGEGFVDKVAEYQPDLVTIDVILPDIDGFEIFDELQKDNRTKEIPAIFVTVVAEEEVKGVKMGAKAYIVKPFKEMELKEAIKSVLEKI